MMKRTLAVLFLVLPLMSFADEGAAPEAAATLEAGRHNFFANVGIDVARNSALTPSSASYTLGGKYSYFFKKKVGVFVGVDYVDRTYSVSSTSVTAPTLDLPFGIVFNYVTHNFADEGAIFLGLSYQSPMGVKFKGGGPTDEASGKGSLALYLGSGSYFKVDDNFLLGLVVDVKFGFADSIEVKQSNVTDSGKTADIMIGLGAKFN